MPKTRVVDELCVLLNEARNIRHGNKIIFMSCEAATVVLVDNLEPTLMELKELRKVHAGESLEEAKISSQDEMGRCFN